MKIMFMGTPEISATCLERLLADGHEVTSVITREDKPRGRKMVMTPTVVKTLATERNIPVYTPTTLRDDAFAELLSELSPELIVVVAYGKILPKSVIDFPKYGCINLHVSLLPKYRGAAPMQRAIMEGEKETGVTVMYMDEGLDTGDIIAKEVFPIGPADDFEAIHDRSADIGSALLSKTIFEIEKGNVKREKQNDAEATYAAKIEKTDCKIDFSLPAHVIDCRIRGTTPIPGALCYHGGKMLKIYRATPTDGVGKIGEVIAIDAKGEGARPLLSGFSLEIKRGMMSSTIRSICSRSMTSSASTPSLAVLTL